MMRLLFTLCCILGLSAARADVGALSSVSGTGDSERFYSYRVRGGAVFDYRSYLRYYGLTAQNTHYAQGGWHKDGQGLIGVWRRQDRTTLAGINAEGGVVQVAGRTRVVGDATWSFRPQSSTGLELIAAGDLVETPGAIDRAIAYGFYGASIEQQITKRLSAIGLVAYQPFTDGNERVHLRGRLIWDLIPDYGLTAQVRWRQYRSSEGDLAHPYFNPNQYRQWQAALAMRKRLSGGWIWSSTLAAGQETINNDRTQPTTLIELRAEGPIARNARLALTALYTRSTGYIDAPHYWYAQLGLTLIVPF
jgi:hypothetical protein